ncbi:MAG TPA: hypothetical protein VM432_00220 [Bdellovibrionales bacterium]|nr:hypothetical protein [Bdellovibrionales bacterium]
MKQHLVFLLLCLMGLPAFAAGQARVIKTKGYQAIVQFPEGEKPQVGQVIDLNADDGPGDAGGPIGTGARAHSLQVQGELGILSRAKSGNGADENETVTRISVSGRYGWNFVDFEAGPLGSFSMESAETNTTVFAVGGFFDWNLVPNRPGTVFVYGAGGYGTFGQESTSGSGSSSSSFTRMEFFGGGNMKWFGLSDSVAVRVDAGIGYSRSGNTQTITEMGFRTLGGLAFYF